MNQQQKPQTPQGQQQQVPDHRFDEIQAQMRKLELQNQQLRGHIDALTQRQPQGQKPQEEESGFKPEVAQQLEKFVQRYVAPLQQELKNSLGMLYDSQDESRYQLKYSGDRWTKYQPKVENLRQEMQAQGKWITREQALQMVYFEDTGKKPAPEAAKPEAQPVYDPYFNGLVDPVTRLPVTPQAAAPQQEQMPQELQQQNLGNFNAPQEQWQPQQQQQFQQQAPQQKPMLPYGNEPRPQFGLPAQGVNSSNAPAHQQMRAPRELSIESSDAELEAFEKTMGDIPF